MKKLLPLLLSLLLLWGCGAAPDARHSGKTYTDDLGRTVSIDAPPQRVASLLGSFSDVWLLSGGQLAASADDAWDDFGLELPDAVNLGKTKDPSLEKLLEIQPDLVLASTNTPANLDMLPTLEAAGIPVLFFDVAGFDDYLRMLKLCTDITGRPELYEQHGETVARRVEECAGRTRQALSGKPPKILYLRAAASGIRAKNSHGNVLGEMLADLGCVNIADSDGSLLENLSVEHILLQDPDYIFFVQQGDDTAATKANMEALFAENPAWQSLTAVKEGRVFLLEKRLYSLKPNALWADAYEELEAILCEKTP